MKMQSYTLKKIQNKLEKCLEKERYDHTIGVMYTAAALAMCHDEDIEKALLAGLLHDCAKGLSNDRQKELCIKYDIDISDIEMKNPGLLHAKLGAYVADKKYNVRHPDVIQAITYHTTGKPAMTKLDKIIYIADYIEPGRKMLPDMTLARTLAFQNLDECLYVILKGSLEYLHSKQLLIDPMTEKAYDYYKEKRKKQEEL